MPQLQDTENSIWFIEHMIKPHYITHQQGCPFTYSGLLNWLVTWEGTDVLPEKSQTECKKDWFCGEYISHFSLCYWRKSHSNILHMTLVSNFIQLLQRKTKRSTQNGNWARNYICTGQLYSSFIQSPHESQKNKWL